MTIFSAHRWPLGVHNDGVITYFYFWNVFFTLKNDDSCWVSKKRLVRLTIFLTLSWQHGNSKDNGVLFSRSMVWFWKYEFELIPLNFSNFSGSLFSLLMDKNPINCSTFFWQWLQSLLQYYEWMKEWMKSLFLFSMITIINEENHFD